MKEMKRILCLAAALLLLLGFAPRARAEEESAESFEGKTWEELVQELMDEYKIREDQVAMGYLNTVTGETHYVRGDTYMVTASMYKVPINMVFTERISKGEMDWDTVISGLTYEQILEKTIIDSDNDAAEKLWLKLGGYQKYREIICPYMGVDPETVDKMYWVNNYFTAEQMIHCLSMLQAEPERFPRLEETMRRAEPNRFFLYHEQPVEIAHKFGYVPDKSGTYFNDCAICYTDEPICIVLFTVGGGMKVESFLADFCTLMCDWAQYTAERDRKAQEEQIAAAAMAVTGGEETQEERVPYVSETLPPQSEEAGRLVDQTVIAPSQGQLVLGGVIVVLALAALITLIPAAHRGKLSFGWGFFAVLALTAALLLCVAAPTLSEKLNRPEGDPRESVTGFFDALKAQDYEHAYGCLEGYSSLGLENEPEDAMARRVFEALRGSYSYILEGDCTVNGASGTQRVLLRHLDLGALHADLRYETEAVLTRKVQELSRAELYDENGAYRTEITTAAYEEAVETLAERAEDYMHVSPLELELHYSAAEGWQIVVSPALTAALSGTDGVGGGAAS